MYLYIIIYKYYIYHNVSKKRLFVICINGSFRFVPSLLTASVPSLPVFLSFLFLSSCLPPSLAAFENKNVKRYNVNALSKIKNVTM